MSYHTDLAYIHHTGYGDYSRRAAPELLKRISQVQADSNKVVDLGCGSGIWAAELLKAGYEVEGWDISSAMIELAKEQAPQATFHVGSFLKAQLPMCKAVTAIGEVVCYLFDEDNTPLHLDGFFAQVAAALPPGGLFLFDICTLAMASPPPPGQTVKDDWACFVRLECHDNVLHRYITTFRQGEDQLYRRTDELHRTRLHDSKVLASQLAAHGFDVEVADGYGDFPMLPGRAAILACRQ